MINTSITSSVKTFDSLIALNKDNIQTPRRVARIVSTRKGFVLFSQQSKKTRSVVKIAKKPFFIKYNTDSFEYCKNSIHFLRKLSLYSFSIFQQKQIRVFLWLNYFKKLTGFKLINKFPFLFVKLTWLALLKVAFYNLSISSFLNKNSNSLNLEKRNKLLSNILIKRQFLLSSNLPLYKTNIIGSLILPYYNKNLLTTFHNNARLPFWTKYSPTITQSSILKLGSSATLVSQWLIDNLSGHKTNLQELGSAICSLVIKHPRVRGIRLKIKGRFGKKDAIAYKVQITRGSASTQTFDRIVDYSAISTRTKLGAVGFKVWISYY